MNSETGPLDWEGDVAKDLITRLRALGLRMSCSHGRILVSPPGQVPSHLAEQVRAARAAVLRVLETEGQRPFAATPCAGLDRPHMQYGSARTAVLPFMADEEASQRREQATRLLAEHPHAPRAVCVGDATPDGEVLIGVLLRGGQYAEILVACQRWDEARAAQLVVHSLARARVPDREVAD